MDLEDEEEDEWAGADDVMDDDDDEGTLPPNDSEDIPPEVPNFAELLAVAADGGELTEEQAFRLALALSIEGNEEGNAGGANAAGENADEEYLIAQSQEESLAGSVPPIPPVPRFAWGSMMTGNDNSNSNNSSHGTSNNNNNSGIPVVSSLTASGGPFAPGSLSSEVTSENEDLRSPEKLQHPATLSQQIGSASVMSPRLTVLLLEGATEGLRSLTDCPAIRCIPTLKMLFSLLRNASVDDLAVSRAVTNALQALGLSFSTKAESAITGGNVRLSDYHLLVARLLASLFASVTNSLPSHKHHSNAANLTDVIYAGIKNYLPAILQTFLTCVNERFLARQSRPSTTTATAPNTESNAVKSTDHLRMLPSSSYDLHPFVETNISTGNVEDLFKDYDIAVIDSILRFLSRLKSFLDKQATSPSSQLATSAAVVLRSDEWASALCGLLSIRSLAPAHRQIRRVLQQILGGPEEYRNFRDMNELESTLDRLTSLLVSSGNRQQFPCAPSMLPYDRLLEVCEQLKHCTDVAAGRPASLARLFSRRSDLITNVLQMCSAVPTDEIRLSLLQLLDTSLQQPKDVTGKHIANVMLTQVPQQVMSDFLQVVVLSSNTSSVRWVGHDVVLALAKSTSPANFRLLLISLEGIFRRFSISGMRAAQIVDLFGFCLLGLKTAERQQSDSSDLVKSSLDFTVSSLEKANIGIKQHPNAGIYSRLATAIGGLNAGYYLETAQCTSCANFQETAFAQVKLQSLKSDAKFTSTTQTFKLSGGSHQIASIAFKFVDVKKHRMIKTINLYYNNRFSVPLVDLKGRPALWQRAKTISLVRQQSDARIDFLVPITAGNLMFEIAEFYENKSANSSGPGGSEVVQCPRCSNVVTGSSGVCSNCGENVFQCHKCRAIHLLYDERDPFMCASCGYSKYVKIETIVTCRPSPSVEPIESDVDYEKTLTVVDSLLEKLDQNYQQLNSYRANVIALLDRLGGREDLTRTAGDSSQSATSNENAENSAQINPVIQQLVTRYAHDCRHTAGELSRLAERLRACRMELLNYEARRNNTVMQIMSSPQEGPRLSFSQSQLPVNLCFTCLTSTVMHCLTLLRAFALSDSGRRLLSEHVQVLVPLLLELSATSTSNRIRADARAILTVLTALYPDAARGLANAISVEATSWLAKGAPPDDVPFIRSSVQMLASSALRNDPSWETYFRTAVQLFVEGTQRPILSPFVWEALMGPILEMFFEMLKPAAYPQEQGAEGGRSGKMYQTGNRRQQQQLQSSDQKSNINVAEGFVVDVIAWLSSDPRVCFTKWRQAQQSAVSVYGKSSAAWQDSVKRALSLRNRGSARTKYLLEKYASLWRMALIRRRMCPLLNLRLEEVGSMPLLSSWVKAALFCPYSAGVRQLVSSVLEAMVAIAPVHLRRCHIVAFLTPCLEDVVQSEAVCEQFVTLYKKLIATPQWRIYMTIKGGLRRIFRLIDSEIRALSETEMAAVYSSLGGFAGGASSGMFGFSNGLSSVSLTRGTGLGALVDILASLLEVEQIRNCHKKESVSLMLRGYLALRRLVASRTRAIDRTQAAMLALLDTLTGTAEADRRELADICISIVRTMPFDDYKSPAYVFERLCEIIHPEEKQKDDFTMIIEKCPEQEEFLQGRMLGNPYKSTDPGMGPLMRDIKNKICHDCELIALLEDENSMELLIRNKIINLTLPVKDVYRRVWLAEAGSQSSTEPMRVVYRMRGLLGDATEDVVESLPPIDANVDKEETFKMASLMASSSGGLSVVLDRLAGIENVAAGKPLLAVAIKLLSYSVNVAVNRRKLTEPTLGAVSSLLTALTRCLRAESADTTTSNRQPTGPPTTPRAQGQASTSESGTLSQELCRLIEIILSEAAQLPASEHAEFASRCASIGQIEQLLQLAVTSVRSNSAVLHSLMHILPYLALGSPECMAALIKYFRPYCAAFSRLDQERSADDQLIIDCFCTVVQNIDVGEYGSHLKDLIVTEGILGMAVEYIQLHTPSGKWAPDSPEWRELASRPAVPYVLRILAGLVKGHRQSQQYVADNCLRQLHQTEQACSANNIGPLAEAVLDAVVDSPEAKQSVNEIREATRQEKKRLAMNRRQKQLADLGMATDEATGKVRVTTTPRASMQAAAMIQEEPGLACCICREGYKSSPNRLLAIYTYTRYAPLDEFDPRGRPGVATASSLVCVHIDCHDNAVASHTRSSSGQADWTLAQLHNAGARCNGLLPTQGPGVSEQQFNIALQRYNVNVCEVAALAMTSSGGWSYSLVIHDVKHLLLQLAHQRPFSAEWGGGGRETNLQLVPHLLYLALYSLTNHETAQARDTVVISFLEQPSARWVSSAYEPDGPFFYTVLSLLIVDREQWQAVRLGLLRRILISAHARHQSPNQPIDSLGPGDRQIFAFDVYRPALLFFALADSIYSTLWPRLSANPTWPEALVSYIRKNDAALTEACGKLLSKFDNDMVPAELDEFADLLNLHDEVADPSAFVKETIASAP